MSITSSFLFYYIMAAKKLGVGRLLSQRAKGKGQRGNGRWKDGGVWGVWGERFLPHPPTPPTPPTLPACPCPINN